MVEELFEIICEEIKRHAHELGETEEYAMCEIIQNIILTFHAELYSQGKDSQAYWEKIRKMMNETDKETK